MQRKMIRAKFLYLPLLVTLRLEMLISHGHISKVSAAHKMKPVSSPITHRTKEYKPS